MTHRTFVDLGRTLVDGWGLSKEPAELPCDQQQVAILAYIANRIARIAKILDDPEAHEQERARSRHDRARNAEFDKRWERSERIVPCLLRAATSRLGTAPSSYIRSKVRALLRSVILNAIEKDPTVSDETLIATPLPERITDKDGVTQTRYREWLNGKANESGPDDSGTAAAATKTSGD